MEFKIDTKGSYTHITPVANCLDANLTGALNQKCHELQQNGSHNFIVDLHNCIILENAAVPGLMKLHEECYAANQSLVFTGLQDEVVKQLNGQHVETLLNVAPTLDEAIDIVSMEILERELFNEES